MPQNPPYLSWLLNLEKVRACTASWHWQPRNYWLVKMSLREICWSWLRSTTRYHYFFESLYYVCHSWLLIRSFHKDSMVLSKKLDFLCGTFGDLTNGIPMFPGIQRCYILDSKFIKLHFKIMASFLTRKFISEASCIMQLHIILCASNLFIYIIVTLSELPSKPKSTSFCGWQEDY